MRGIWIAMFMSAMLATMARGATTSPATTQAGGIDLANPTLVTLHLKQATMADACAALAKQAAELTQINFPNVKDVKFDPVAVDVENQPYLIALAKICTAGKATYGPFARESGIELRPLDFMRSPLADLDPVDLETSWLASPSSVQGPVLVVARSISTGLSVNLENRAAKRSPSFTVSLSLLVEPQVHVTAISPFAEVIEAVDENGISMAPSHEFHEQWVEYPSETPLHFPAVLRTQDAVGAKLALLRGKLHVRLVKRMQTVEIGGFDADQTVKVAGHECKVAAVKNSGQGERHVTITMMRGDTNPTEWKALCNRVQAGSEFRLVDDKGMAIELYGKDTQPQGNGLKITLRYSRGNGRVPAKLTWRVPLATVDEAIGFEFKDLPLP